MSETAARTKRRRAGKGGSSDPYAMNTVVPALERKTTVFVDKVPLPLKQAIKDAADEQETSFHELAVRTLCEHYGLNVPVPPQTTHTRVLEGSPRVVLQVPPTLWRKIMAEKMRTRRSMKRIVIDIFEANFGSLTA